MKKIYIAIALFAIITVSVAQTKSTGTETLGGLMTLKIDKNSTTSTVTVTLTGPSDKWFAIGLNVFGGMDAGTDCLYYTTTFVDGIINGFQAPVADSVNNWVVSSNTVVGTTRTLVLTRNFVGGTGDYPFVYNDNALNVIWAYGSGTSLAYHNGNRGSRALNFTVLGVDDFAALDKVSIAPNPSNGIFTITKNSQTSISKVTVFDINGKVVKVIDSELNFDTTTVDLSTFSKGVYFMEIANETDKVVRKILLE
jgi:hypothetical protein